VDAAQSEAPPMHECCARENRETPWISAGVQAGRLEKAMPPKSIDGESAPFDWQFTMRGLDA
jgi:hypothetical protein